MNPFPPTRPTAAAHLLPLVRSEEHVGGQGALGRVGVLQGMGVGRQAAWAVSGRSRVGDNAAWGGRTADCWLLPGYLIWPRLPANHQPAWQAGPAHSRVGQLKFEGQCRAAMLPRSRGLASPRTCRAALHVRPIAHVRLPRATAGAGVRRG